MARNRWQVGVHIRDLLIVWIWTSSPECIVKLFSREADEKWPQTVQISYSIYFRQIHVHYPQHLLTFYVFVLSLSVHIKRTMAHIITTVLDVHRNLPKNYWKLGNNYDIGLGLMFRVSDRQRHYMYTVQLGTVVYFIWTPEFIIRQKMSIAWLFLIWSYYE